MTTARDTEPAPPPEETRPHNDHPSASMPVIDPVPLPGGADPILQILVEELRAARQGTAETYAVASESLSVLRDVQGTMARLEALARVQEQHGRQLTAHEELIEGLTRKVAILEAELREVKATLEEVRGRG